MDKLNCFLGIDIGSVSTNVVLLNENNNIVESIYVRTEGRPIEVLQKVLAQLYQKYGERLKISGVGATGSGRNLAAIMVGADTVKNEITAHAKAAIHFIPNVRTVIEIGGQDSKIILIKNEIVVDFAMNTICAAGTGSFLDRQAERLNIPIERLGEIAIKSKNPVRIAGRCAVFAESDMIHKQQLGHLSEDILFGLCLALARNYISNVAKGKTIEEPIIFQGGVAANIAMKKAFEQVLQKEIVVPQYFNVMGAIGIALLAKEKTKGLISNFKGFDCINNSKFETRGFECKGCSNNCEVVEFYNNNNLVATWGDRCQRYSSSKNHHVEKSKNL
ncbi:MULTISPECIES: acyl-CoA dehydratase activase [unclassified Caldicellulosiruptor]|uniref:acyl-CoA dehydratase activase n=1 Tax=unclassified Caldicellulosiruptor TaxID=2622462 RepID=UPI00039DB06E|nr:MULTISPECIES: acyl-CoA dehydratase activase [unclassified Caldicellulosiruptor]